MVSRCREADGSGAEDQEFPGRRAWSAHVPSCRRRHVDEGVQWFSAPDLFPANEDIHHASDRRTRDGVDSARATIRRQQIRWKLLCLSGNEGLGISDLGFAELKLAQTSDELRTLRRKGDLRTAGLRVRKRGDGQKRRRGQEPHDQPPHPPPA